MSELQGLARRLDEMVGPSKDKPRIPARDCGYARSFAYRRLSGNALRATSSTAVKDDGPKTSLRFQPAAR